MKSAHLAISIHPGEEAKKKKERNEKEREVAVFFSPRLVRINKWFLSASCLSLLASNKFYISLGELLANQTLIMSYHVVFFFIKLVKNLFQPRSVHWTGIQQNSGFYFHSGKRSDILVMKLVGQRKLHIHYYYTYRALFSME